MIFFSSKLGGGYVLDKALLRETAACRTKVNCNVPAGHESCVLAETMMAVCTVLVR